MGHKVLDVVAVVKPPECGVGLVAFPKVKDVAVPAVVAALKREHALSAVCLGWLHAGHQLLTELLHVCNVLRLGMEHLDAHHIFVRSLLDCCSHLQMMSGLAV